MIGARCSWGCRNSTFVDCKSCVVDMYDFGKNPFLKAEPPTFGLATTRNFEWRPERDDSSIKTWRGMRLKIKRLKDLLSAVPDNGAPAWQQPERENLLEQIDWWTFQLAHAQYN